MKESIELIHPRVVSVITVTEVVIMHVTVLRKEEDQTQEESIIVEEEIEVPAPITGINKIHKAP